MTTGYACPVCDDPQADIGHLANHLAFTAMLRKEAHADWLDEHVPAWNEYDEAELSAALEEHTDHLEERDYPQVFEDTTGSDGSAGRDDPAERSGALFDDGGDHGHDHGHQHGHAREDQHGHDHGHAQGTGRDAGHGPSGIPDHVDTAAVPGGEIDEEEHEAIMEEAREMTRQLREDAGDRDEESAAGDTGEESAVGNGDDEGTGDRDDE
jgi:hypothetical protein